MKDKRKKAEKVRQKLFDNFSLDYFKIEVNYENYNQIHKMVYIN